ncbi:MAG: hypothetical protein BWY78_00615 [Alphaproteobacteria bacterium ADurb.Bin438]|nr:MAG: hypothetical protein BWY78_00615 [Alphaproteobacteria bacterium ADurb.Bin438]
MNIENIADIFDEIYETGAIIVKPAEAMEIARCQRDLHDIGAPSLPLEYIEFLKIANGFAWNGFEFYGTYQISDNNSDFEMQDIVSVNHKLRQMKELGNRIVLGKFDEDIYVYDFDAKEYMSLDKLTLIDISSFSSFEELLSEEVSSIVTYLEEDETEQENDE